MVSRSLSWLDSWWICCSLVGRPSRDLYWLSRGSLRYPSPYLKVDSYQFYNTFYKHCFTLKGEFNVIKQKSYHCEWDICLSYITSSRIKRLLVQLEIFSLFLCFSSYTLTGNTYLIIIILLLIIIKIIIMTFIN